MTCKTALTSAPHYDWDSYGGRPRTSPTPDELRAQAYHALAARVTSLYWFNLSLPSLLKFPDLIEPVTRVGREIRVLADFYLEGDAYHYERIQTGVRPDWDLSVIAGPRGGLLFALDLTYQPDPDKKVFQFGPPRDAVLRFPLPAYLRAPAQVLRADADAVVPVPFERTGEGIQIQGRFGDVNVFAVSTREDERDLLEARRTQLAAWEESFGFDPGRDPADLDQLRALLAK